MLSILVWPEQNLYRPEISGSPVDQHRLRAPHGVRAERQRVESDTCHPFADQPGVLPCRQMLPRAATARKQALAGGSTCLAQVGIDGFACQIGQFEANRPRGFLLPHRRPVGSAPRGGLGPTSLPLFHGGRRGGFAVATVSLSFMTGLLVEAQHAA